jgi:ABC-2 type transport system permease protein
MPRIVPLTVRLFTAMASASLRRSLANRADLAFELAMAVVGSASSLAALGAVYTRTGSLAGWDPASAVVLLGTFAIVSGLRATFVEPNVQWFHQRISGGRFDYILTQPASSLFLATLGGCAPAALVQSAVGAALVAGGLAAQPHPPSAPAVLGWLALVTAATAAAWATRTLTAAVAFWALGLTLDVAYDAAWQFGRYPVQLYRRPLDLLLTYVLPVGLIATVPASALVRDATPAADAGALAAAAALCALTTAVWHRGLRRYTSAAG